MATVHGLIVWGIFALLVLLIGLMAFVHRVHKESQRTIAQINELTIRLSRYDVLDRRKH